MSIKAVPYRYKKFARRGLKPSYSIDKTFFRSSYHRIKAKLTMLIQRNSLNIVKIEN